MSGTLVPLRLVPPLDTIFPIYIIQSVGWYLTSVVPRIRPIPNAPILGVVLFHFTGHGGDGCCSWQGRIRDWYMMFWPVRIPPGAGFENQELRRIFSQKHRQQIRTGDSRAPATLHTHKLPKESRSWSNKKTDRCRLCSPRSVIRQGGSARVPRP